MLRKTSSSFRSAASSIQATPSIRSLTWLGLFLVFALTWWAYAAPPAPGAPTFTNPTATSVTVVAPSLPTGATSMTLQRKLSSQADTSYASIKTGLVGAGTYADSGLTVATSYAYRCIAISTSGNTNGTAATFVTSAAPSAPAAPTISNLTATTLTSTAPALSTNAKTLTLQQKLTSAADTTYVDVASGLAGGAATNITGLSLATGYTFRYRAVSGAAVTSGTAVSVTTKPAPSAPSAPTFSAITQTSLTITAPALPANTSTLTLQQKLTSAADSTYVSIQTGMAGAATKAVSGLTSNTSYTFRFVAVSGAATTNGTAAPISTLAQPGTPGAPTFSNVAATTLTVTAPALPVNTTSLTLQQKLASEADTAYVSIQSGMAGGATKNVTGLTSGTAYTFRFVAVSGGASTNGTAANRTTLSLPSTPGAPTFSSPQATSVVVTAPALPANSTSLTLQRKLASEADTSYGNPITGLAGGSNRTITGLTLNTAYIFRYQAVGAGGTTSGPGANFTTTGRPANDDFANATVLSGTSGTIAGTNVAATKEVGEPDHWNGAQQYSVWYQWTAPRNGTAIFTTAGSNFDTVMAVYTGSAINALTLIVKNDDSGGVTSRVSFNASLGTTYRIAVDSFSSQTGAISLSWEPVLPPEAPQAPTFSNVSFDSLTVTAPALPVRATSLSLQRKLSSEADTAYVVAASSLLAGSATSITNLTASTTYSFRYVGVNAEGETVGTASNVSTLPPPLPGAPAEPSPNDVAQTSLKLRLPALPQYAATLTLQRATKSGASPVTVPSTGLKVWFKADSVAGLATGSPLSSWGDSSGNARHATQVNPAMRPQWLSNGPGGKPTVRLDGVDDLVRFEAQTTLRTVFVVARHATGSQDWSPILGSEFGHFHGGPGSALFSSDYTAASIKDGLGFINGVATPPLSMTKSISYQVVSLVTSEPVQVDGISAQYGWGGRNWNGDYAEVLLYDSVLSATDRQAVETYLISKYGLETAPPGNTVWTNIATGLAGDALYSDDSVLPNTGYWYRAVAINSTGSTPGPATAVTTASPSPVAPSAPAAPIFTLPASTSVRVTAPALPSNSYWLALQRKLSGASDSTYVTIAQAVSAGEISLAEGLASQTSYTFRYLAVGDGLTTPGTPANTLTTALIAVGNGTGLRGTYYNNTDFSNSAFTRVDPQVNFAWGSGSPGPLIAPDYFSVRWEGQVEPLYTETYTFSADADNAVRIWVNGQQIINRWSDEAGEVSGQITLNEGVKTNIKIEYAENVGTAHMKFSWASASQLKQLVPASQIYPTPAPVGSGTGLRGQYFDDLDFNLDTQVLSRTDAQINFNWGDGSPSRSIGADTFGIWWTGQIKVPFTETYTFRTEIDDDSRLWINGQLVTNAWQGRGPASGTISLVAGQSYDIKLQSREFGGQASAKLFWSSASQAEQIVPQAYLYPALSDSAPYADPPEPRDAHFISQQVPLTMVAGRTYPVTVRFKNMGVNTWTAAEGYKLGRDDSPWGLTRVDVPTNVSTGQEVSFNFSVTAPATPGTYDFQWRMIQQNVTWFGNDSPNQRIVVKPAPLLTIEEVTASQVRLKLPMWPEGASGLTLQRAVGTIQTPSLPNIAGLSVWLKADAVTGLTSGSPLGSWNDSSGNARHAAQSDAAMRPHWISNGPGGKPIVRMDGGDDLLRFEAQTNLRTIFVVARHATGSQDWAPLLGSDPIHFHGGPGSNLFSGEYTNGAIKDGQGFINGVATSPLSMVKSTSYQILSLITTAPVQADGISAQYGWGGRNWNGDYAEVLLYDSVLSTADRKSVEAYLGGKYQIATAPPTGAVWTDIATNLADQATYTDGNLPSNTSYWYRCVAEGLAGAVPGEPVHATTASPLPPAPGAPGTPGAPTFSNVTATSVSVTAPVLPANALSLTLQKRLQSEADDAYVIIRSGLAANATTSVTGLESGTAYSFRYVAVGEGGSTPGAAANVTTLASAVQRPGTPEFHNVTQTTLYALMPDLPLGATSLSLQRKLASQVDSSYADIATGLAGGEDIAVTGLTASTAYTFRAVAFGASGTNAGLGAGVTTGTAPPASPGAPQFSNLGAYSVTVTSPSLPAMAASMILQGKAADQADALFFDIEDEITTAGISSDVTGLNPSSSYVFRYVALNSGGRTPGIAASVTTQSVLVAWGAGSNIECSGIRQPKPNLVVAAGSALRLSSFVAVDWDALNVTVAGQTTGARYSDPCTYNWAASGGGFQGGVTKGQSVQWIAPTSPGTYTVTLTVDDQNAANQSPTDIGSRNDAAKGFNDDPVKFSVSVTVL